VYLGDSPARWIAIVGFCRAIGIEDIGG